MSFGFSQPSEVISQAISNVRERRRGSVIFLARAGNDAADLPASFPACHPSVIAVYAARSTGAFSETNPSQSAGQSKELIGTFGDNIPEEVYKDLKTRFPDANFSPGTSIA